MPPLEETEILLVACAYVAQIGDYLFILVVSVCLFLSLITAVFGDKGVYFKSVVLVMIGLIWYLAPYQGLYENDPRLVCRWHRYLFMPLPGFIAASLYAAVALAFTVFDGKQKRYGRYDKIQRLLSWFLAIIFYTVTYINVITVGLLRDVESAEYIAFWSAPIVIIAPLVLALFWVRGNPDRRFQVQLGIGLLVLFVISLLYVLYA